MLQTDVLIIGTGIAGATAALRLARNPQRRVTLITRDPDPHESNTYWAQGGIIYRGPDDNADLLVKDILAAGAGASLPSAARILAEEGPKLLQEILIETANIHFDKDDSGALAYGQEAAHSMRRIIHVADGTGAAISKGLMTALKQMPNITWFTNATAVDLITYPHHARDPLSAYQPIKCFGAYVFDGNGLAVHRTLAATTILATGGLGRIFRNTTNPRGARGDGLAMANRAGARIVNAEYIQFHPTALAVPGAEGFLISEAVRGEGGVLLTPEGRAFMEEYSPEWKDLAPRDVVARAIHHQMETYGYSHVLLDIATHMPAKAIRERFPNIYSACKQVGIDITREPIPVVPAAHYFLRRRASERVGTRQYRKSICHWRSKLHRIARSKPACFHFSSGRIWYGATAPRGTLNSAFEMKQSTFPARTMCHPGMRVEWTPNLTPRSFRATCKQSKILCGITSAWHAMQIVSHAPYANCAICGTKSRPFTALQN